jgi:hypothetical protein
MPQPQTERCPKRRIDWARIEVALRAELESAAPRGLTPMARQLGVHPVQIRHRLPAIASELVKRAGMARLRRSEERLTELVSMIERIVEDLRTEGIQPTRRQVEGRLANHVILREPALGRAWRALSNAVQSGERGPTP